MITLKHPNIIAYVEGEDLQLIAMLYEYPLNKYYVMQTHFKTKEEGMKYLGTLGYPVKMSRSRQYGHDD